MAGLNAPGADVSIIAVRDAWTQDNKDRYAWPTLPACKVDKIDDDASGTTTYQLPDFGRYLLDTDGDGTGMAWQPGVQPPTLRDNAETTVTVEALGYAAPDVDGRPLRSSAPRDKSLDRLVPAQLSIVYQIMENALANHLTNTSNFTSQTWSAVLDTGNVELLRELNNKLLPFRKYEGSRYKLVAIGDRRTLSIMASYRDFSGGGTGSAAVDFSSPAKVKSVLGEYLGIEEVTEIKAAYNSAARGQTKTVADIGRGFFWVGLVDRQGGYDLTQIKNIGPDGGLAMAIGQEPYVEAWEDRGASYEYVHGRCQFGIVTPRTVGGPSSGKWGMFFPTAQNIT